MTANLSEPIELQIKNLKLNLAVLGKRKPLRKVPKRFTEVSSKVSKCTETADCPVCEQSIGGTLKHQVETKLANLSDGTKIKEELTAKKSELEGKLQMLCRCAQCNKKLTVWDRPSCLNCELNWADWRKPNRPAAVWVKKRSWMRRWRSRTDALNWSKGKLTMERLARELCALQHERQSLLDKMSSGSAGSEPTDPETLERHWERASHGAKVCRVGGTTYAGSPSKETELAQGKRGCVTERKTDETENATKRTWTTHEITRGIQKRPWKTSKWIAKDSRWLGSVTGALKQARESREAGTVEPKNAWKCHRIPLTLLWSCSRNWTPCRPKLSDLKGPAVIRKPCWFGILDRGMRGKD